MYYHDIKHDDMLNGSGLRVTLFVSGCGHKCKNCQNPQTWSPKSGIKFDNRAVREIERQLEQDYISGLTLCGGDPLYKTNVSELTTLTSKLKVKYPDKNIWMYTGDLWENVKHLEIMQFIDVLIDGPYIEDLNDIHYPWAGSTNQRVIDVQASLRSDEIVMYVDEAILNYEERYKPTDIIKHHSSCCI